MLQVLDAWPNITFHKGIPLAGYPDDGDNTNSSSCHLLSIYYVLGSLYTLFHPRNP